MTFDLSYNLQGMYIHISVGQSEVDFWGLSGWRRGRGLTVGNSFVSSSRLSEVFLVSGWDGQVFD